MNYAERIKIVQQQIEEAAISSGRKKTDVQLIAVSKTHPQAVVADAVATGLITDLGENRVQEAMEKVPDFPYNVRWHLIGQLQRNKVRKALSLFSVIQSVDSLALAQKLETVAFELGLRPTVFLEVNTSDEESKSGCKPEEALALADFLAGCERLQFEGLMTVGPLTDQSVLRHQAFEKLRLLQEQLRKQTGLMLPHLSMGMSADFKEAILEGSTMVRIGTAIFGARTYEGGF